MLVQVTTHLIGLRDKDRFQLDLQLSLCRQKVQWYHPKVSSGRIISKKKPFLRLGFFF